MKDNVKYLHSINDHKFYPLTVSGLQSFRKQTNVVSSISINSTS